MLALLQPVDDLRGQTPRILDGDIGMPADRDALQRAARRPRVNHIDLAPGAMNPDPESGEVAVVEDPVSALDRERIDDPLIQPDGTLSRHAPLPYLPMTERIAARDLRGGRPGARKFREQPDTDQHSMLVYERPSVTRMQALSRACLES